MPTQFIVLFIVTSLGIHNSQVLDIYNVDSGIKLIRKLLLISFYTSTTNMQNSNRVCTSGYVVMHSSSCPQGEGQGEEVPQLAWQVLSEKSIKELAALPVQEAARWALYVMHILEIERWIDSFVSHTVYNCIRPSLTHMTIYSYHYIRKHKNSVSGMGYLATLALN